MYDLLSVYGEASLSIWYGLPGSGKSYQANIIQVDWLLAGQPVLTNLHIKSIPKMLVNRPGEYKALEDTDFDVNPATGTLKFLEWLEDIKVRNPHSHPLLVIDECHSLFAARNWKGNDKGGFFDWISQHRHMNVSVLLISQDYSLLDKNLRLRAQFFRYHRNLVKDPILSNLLFLFGRNIHLGISYFPNDGKPDKKQPYERKWFTIKSKKARYSSGQMHGLKLTDTFRGRSDVKRKVVVLFGLGVVIVLCIGVKQLWKELTKSPDIVRAEAPELIQVPDLETTLDAFYTDEKHNVILVFDDGTEFKTNSPDIEKWEDLVGEKISIPRDPIKRRFWHEDILEYDYQVKTVSNKKANGQGGDLSSVGNFEP